MGHDHSHHHHIEPKALNNAFIIGIVLNLAFVFIEAGIGLSVHSLSLLSDAGHNLADVASLVLSLLAFRLMKVKPTKTYTYGYRKTSILVALFNGMILLLSIGAIAYESVHRFMNPQVVPGNTIAWVAAIGILINGVTALLFFREKNKDLNIKSAYLHLMADALVSLGLVIGGILIQKTNWYWLDPAISLIVVVVILNGTWKLMKDSLRLSLDGVPHEISLEKIKTEALKIKGVKNIHHIHLWAISTTENAMTAHIVIDANNTLSDADKIKHELKHSFEHLKVNHATIEIETEENNCTEIKCE